MTKLPRAIGLAPAVALVLLASAWILPNQWERMRGVLKDVAVLLNLAPQARLKRSLRAERDAIARDLRGLLDPSGGSIPRTP